MPEFSINVPQGINPPLLDQQLKVASVNVSAVGVSGINVRIFLLTDEISDADKVVLEAVCAAHDPTQLTAEQQAAIAQEQAAVTLKGELVQVAQRLQSFKAASLDDVNVLAGDLAVLVQAIIGFY